MSRLARLAAVVVPVLGLAGLWGLSQSTYNQGTEWEVPIAGYDPRDFLRGHYVEFSYDWPEVDEFGDAPLEILCLEGEAPNLTRVVAASAAAGDVSCPHPIRAAATGVYGWDALVRGRLYVGQDRALALQEELRKQDQRGMVTIRQRDDGSFTAISIRFRPLTAEEIAERDAPPEAPLSPFNPLAPPAVMEAP